MAEFVMPILGADMEAGTLVEWHKQVGDTVQRGDIVADVETDKGLIEVEIFATGVIEKILVQPGEKVPVGTVLALIRETGAAAVLEPAAKPPAVPERAVPPPPRPAPPAVAPLREPQPAAPAGARPRVSPAARRLATELGIDLAAVTATGPHGVILREDIERAAAGGPAVHGERAPLAPEDRSARMRQAIGAAMARAKREIPHYYLATTIDLGPATAWVAAQNKSRPVNQRLLVAPVLLKAIALALREFPELNGVFAGGRSVPSERINVGVAVSLRGGGLIVPAVHDTDRLGIDELSSRLRELVQRARTGGLRSSELSDSTITVTSLGERGVETVFPIIYPPQVAIVGFGKVVERPWVVGREVVVRPVVSATLAADHRVSDGHRGGLFLAAVERLLEGPERL
jgi:pyruvate dehydrogenase E2 component (dihydrolipoamide acetyltransferase)